MINRRALPDARKIGRGPCGSLVSHIRQALISRRRRGKDTRRTLQITVSNMWWTKEALQVANNRRRSIVLVSSRTRDQCVIQAMLLPSRLEETPRGRGNPRPPNRILSTSSNLFDLRFGDGTQSVKAGSSIASSTLAGRTRGTSTWTRSAVSQANGENNFGEHSHTSGKLHLSVNKIRLSNFLAIWIFELC